jgi:hypothetical protein
MSNVVPFDKPAQPHIPTPQRRSLAGSWLTNFVDYASAGEAPFETLFWTGVSTIAGALQRRVYIDMRYFQFLPNFYIILVAPPGIIAKSTTANIGMNLLRESGIARFGPEVTTWQSLAQSMALNKDTYVDLGGKSYEQSAVTICADELGNLFDPKNREMVDFLITLWDGKRGTLTKETKTSGTDVIVNPWINIIACTTPAWITANMPETVISGGFTSRCLFVYADQKRQLVAYPGRVVDAKDKQLEFNLVRDLRECIGRLTGQYRLTEEAYEFGENWYTSHNNEKHPYLNSNQFASYRARKQVHIHKLAMVLAASESNELWIQRHHLERAASLVSSVEPHMSMSFEGIGQSQATKSANTLIKLVEDFGPLTEMELVHKAWNFMTGADYEAARTASIHAGYIRRDSVGGKIMIAIGDKKRVDDSIALHYQKDDRSDPFAEFYPH